MKLCSVCRGRGGTTGSRPTLAASMGGGGEGDRKRERYASILVNKMEAANRKRGMTNMKIKNLKHKPTNQNSGSLLGEGVT